MTERVGSTIPGWSCPRVYDLYDEMAKELKPGMVAVECGVAYGKSLAYLASVLDPGVDILAVDIWATFQGRTTMPDVVRSMKRRGFQQPMAAARVHVENALLASDRESYFARWERIEWVQQRSEDVPKYLDFDVDFVFLDDHHEYESVLAEIAAWIPKLKSGGVISGHDCNSHYPGVERAVRDTFGPAWNLDIRKPAPGENGWGGVWRCRKP